MKEIKAIIQPFMLDKVLDALAGYDLKLPGVTVSDIRGWGRRHTQDGSEPSADAGHDFARMAKVEIVVKDEEAGAVVDTIASAAHTGHFGDGKIFVVDIVEAVRIRDNRRGGDAI